MTWLLTCLLAGLAALLWPSRTRSRQPPESRWSTRPGAASDLHGAPPPAGGARHLRVGPGVGPGVGPRVGPGTRPPQRRRWGWRIGRRTGDHESPDDVADALVLVALGLRSGLPLPAALHHVQAGAMGTVRDELCAVVAALRWGLPARDAWAYAGPAWRAAAVATHLSEQTGAGAAQLLEGAASRTRERGERARERAAARAGVLLVLPLGLGFLPAFVCTAVVPVVATLAAGVLSGGS